MRENRDETRLVAYVLGDVDTSERAAIEAALTESEEMRAEVEVIRATVTALQGALALEAQPALTAKQQAAVQEDATRESRGWQAWVFARPAVATLSAAAAVAAIVALIFGLRPSVPEEQPPSPRVVTGTPAPPQRPAPRPSAEAQMGSAQAIDRAPARRPTPSTARAPHATAPTPTPAREPVEAVVATTESPTHTEVRGAGSVRGKILDATGSGVPGATVTLTREDSKYARTALSDATGEYYFPAVAPGSYDLTASLSGFKTRKVSSINLPADNVSLADTTLEVASMAETIQVVADRGLIQTIAGERAQATTPSRQDEPDAISLNGRSVISLARILPGVAQGADGAVATPSPPAVPVPQAVTASDSPPDRALALAQVMNTEAYKRIQDNPFILVAQDPRSTFSIDVDTASYSNVRRFLDGGSLPPKDAVRIEELINYFPHMDEPPRKKGHPFAVHLAAATCPWAPDHTLVRIALKGREVSQKQRPPANLVFLLDVSGSMDEPNKLPLVKDAMRLLVAELRPDDRVAIVVYAGAAGLVLPSTPASDQAAIMAALDRLSAGGSTQGSAGIRLAYQTARRNFAEKGINRVILATDGDFNVGVTNEGDLVRLIEDEAKSGVFLTTLGFGMRNIKDSTLEQLADHGNGSYAYIDTLREARKMLVEQISGTLVTIAKDVKLQLEFNPATVKAFRLIGYENRVLAHQDFADDTKDAGEIGAGHSVTALYEIVPAGGKIAVPGVDPLKYQEPAHPKKGAPKNELLTVKLRYKQPDQQRSRLLEVVLKRRVAKFSRASTDLRFDAAVASFGMLLRDSPFKGSASYSRSLEWARAALGSDPGGYREEFLSLVEKARDLAGHHGTQGE